MKPYVYKATHKTLGLFYIGYRCSNTVDAKDDLAIVYFSSSNTVREDVEMYHFEILCEFDSPLEAYDYEQRLIFENWDNKLCLNRSCFYGKARFRPPEIMSEDHKNKISSSMKGKKFSDDHRKKLSEAKKGRVLSESTKSKMSSSHKGHSTSNETRKKISEKLKGRPLSEEHKRKLSQAAKNRKINREH